MGKDGLLLKNLHKLKPLKKAVSTYSIVPSGEVTEGALEVWRALPEEIRYDPSLASFREQHLKLHGKFKSRSHANLAPIMLSHCCRGSGGVGRC